MGAREKSNLSWGNSLRGNPSDKESMLAKGILQFEVELTWSLSPARTRTFKQR